MIQTVSKAESDKLAERRTQLHQSEWLVDNLTAILMDTKDGGFGLYEPTARAKAHAILNWIGFRSENDALNNRRAPDAPWLKVETIGGPK